MIRKVANRAAWCTAPVALNINANPMKKNMPSMHSFIAPISCRLWTISAAVFLFFLCGTQPLYAAQIIAYGDSITFGRGSSTGGYPPKLDALLENAGISSSVYNRGVPGEDTSQGLARLSGVINSRPADYILIMEGTNDIWIGLSVQTTVFNLGAMVDRSRASGLVPIVANLTPDTNANAAFKNISTTYNPAIRSMASQRGVRFADMYAAVASNWGALNADNLHPNDAGYQIIARTWFNALNLQPPSSASSSSASGSSASNAPAPSGGGGGGGGGSCFIATAAFGSALDRHVVVLKRFRDQKLLTNSIGHRLVQTYYRYSPPLADWLAQRPFWRGIVRCFLYPIVWTTMVYMQTSFAQQLAVAIMFMGLGLFFARRFRKPASEAWR